jgi:chromosome segregation ATPase
VPVSQMNELLEEAARRCADLTREADELRSTIEGVRQRAEDLEARLEEAAGRSHRVAEEAGTRLGAAEDRVASAVSAALGGMDGLRTAASDTRGRVAELLQAARASAAGIEEEKARLTALLEERTGATTEAVTDVAARARQLDADAAAHLDRAAACVDDLRAAVGEARDTVAEAKAALVTALDGVAGGAREGAAGVIEAIDQGAEATAQVRVALANTMLKEHNDAVAVVLGRVADETGDRADEIVPALGAALAALSAICADGGASVRGRADGALARIRMALELAQGLQPSLARGRVSV